MRPSRLSSFPRDSRHEHADPYQSLEESMNDRARATARAWAEFGPECTHVAKMGAPTSLLRLSLHARGLPTFQIGLWLWPSLDARDLAPSVYELGGCIRGRINHYTSSHHTSRCAHPDPPHLPPQGKGVGLQHVFMHHILCCVLCPHALITHLTSLLSLIYNLAPVARRDKQPRFRVTGPPDKYGFAGAPGLGRTPCAPIGTS
eukprot:jgi/Botrbrau1/15890/Bobra.40_1s0073.1